MCTKEIQRIIREYYELTYAKKLDNLEEMDKFLELYNLPRLNHEQIENLNRAITSTDIETVTKNSPKTKVQDETASQINSTKHTIILMPSLIKMLQKMKRRKAT